MADAATWLGAIGTLLAVLVALFGPTVERYRRRPVLALTSDPPPELGSAAKVVGGMTPDGNTIYWLRLAVRNSGRTTAEDVRAILLRIDAPQPFRKQPPSRELKWADVAIDHGSLPPGVSRLIDVLHVSRAVDGSGKERRGLISGVMPLSGADSGEPDSLLWRELAVGNYVAHVSLSARDVTASHYAVNFTVGDPSDLEAVSTSLGSATVQPISRR